MPVVETAHELKELPLYALLAFASRCARRVLGHFRLEDNHPELAACRQAVAEAIRLAEALAAGKAIDPDELAAAEEGTVRAVVAASEMQPPDERAAYAANAAYAALCAAKAALEGQADEPDEELADRIAEAAEIARDSAVSADDRVARAARLDWEMLHRMFLGSFPDFGEPIDAAETGMLGPLFQDRARGAASETKSTPNGEVKEKSRTASAAKSRARKATEPEVAAPGAAGLDQMAEIDSLRKQVESDRYHLQSDRARFDAEKQALHRQLATDKEDLERQQERQSQQQERIDAERHVLNAEAGELNESRRTFEAEKQRLADDRAQLELERQELEATENSVAASRSEVENSRQSLTDARSQFDFDRQQFQQSREQIEQQRLAQLEIDREQFRQSNEQLEQTRFANEQRAGEFAARQTELDSRQIQLDLRDAALSEQYVECERVRERHEQEMANARQQLDAERFEVRAAFDALQQERREFMEQRLGWKPGAAQF